MPPDLTARQIGRLLESLKNFRMLTWHLHQHGRPRARARALAARVTVRACPKFPADRRSWAHVGHRPGPVICLRRGFAVLPREIQVGVLAHEVGHLLGGPRAKPEPPAADLAAELAIADVIYPDRTNAERVDEAHANWRAEHQLGIAIKYDRLLRQVAVRIPWRRRHRRKA